MDEHSLMVAIKNQRDSVKSKLDAQNRWRLKTTAIWLAVLGIAVLLLWTLTNDDTTMSMLLMLTGVSLLVIAVFLYFLSPSRYLRSEVCDAIAISNVLTLRKIFASLLIDSRGIYVPASQAGATKLYIPLTETATTSTDAIPIKGNTVFRITDKNSKGIVIYPPGHALFLYVQRTGALFTEEGLEKEIKDVLENSLEIASNVRVKIEGNKATVQMSKIATADMCKAIRQEDPGICLQMGCPVCSLVGCMVADGTGKRVRIEEVCIEGKTISALYELMGDKNGDQKH